MEFFKIFVIIVLHFWNLQEMYCEKKMFKNIPGLFKSYYFLLEGRWHRNIETEFLSEWERLL